MESFEASLKRLSEIVEKMQNGQVSLEETLKLYREGSSLAEACRKMLDEAELEIKKVTVNGSGELQEEDFAEETI